MKAGKQWKQVQVCKELRSSSIASFSGTFDLILFQAVNFELIVEKVWFGLVWIDGLNKQKITGFWFALIEFGLVWFGLLIPQTHKQINNY